MTEAVGGLISMLRDAAGIRRVELRCDARNERSAAVARRAGFVHEGTLRGDALDVANSPRDTHVFGRLLDPGIAD